MLVASLPPPVTWTGQAAADTSPWTSVAYDGAGTFVAVAFAGEDCKRIGPSNKNAALVCRIKAAGTTLRAKFKRVSSAAASSSGNEALRVAAKFPRRSFSVASLTGVAPFDVHVVTQMGIVYASGDLACKGKASKVSCKTA